jgi:hypothetical protein
MFPIVFPRQSPCYRMLPILNNEVGNLGLKAAHCKNCGHSIRDTYCAHCGQKTATSRLDLEGFIGEMAEVSLLLSERFLFTVREMVFRPAQSMQAYLEGKRQTYQGPVAYFAVCLLVLQLFIRYVYEQGGLLGGTLARLDRQEMFAGMAFDAILVHCLVVRPRLRLLETMVIFLFVYGTVFLLTVPIMILELAYRQQLPVVPVQLRGLFVDIPSLGVMLFYFIRVARFFGVPTVRLGLGLAIGVGTYVVVHQVLGFR